MTFKDLKVLIQKNFNVITTNCGLYEVDIDKDALWNLYLYSFPDGTNPIYRKRREYDCSCCRHFIKEIGGTAYIDDDLNVHSIFDVDTGSPVFQPVMDALDSYIKSCPIKGLYLSNTRSVGTDHSVEMDGNGDHYVWEHFFLTLPNHLVFNGRGTIDTVKGQFRDTRNVFKRSLDEISIDAIDTVLELISSNSIYRGNEWKAAITSLRDQKRIYDTLTPEDQEIYCWKVAPDVGEVVGRIRNHSMGVLLRDLSDGMDLDQAVRKYEAIVAPANYKRPKPIFTKSMLESAQKTVENLGYMASLPRRFARMDDLTVNNILFANRDVAWRISGSVFDEMLPNAQTKTRNFSRVEEISAEKFISDVLPGAQDIEVYVENRHAANLVSLIAPQNAEAPSMFKWANGFSWAYAGNLADSDIRENVKRAGGRVDGVLRFSIQWNDVEYDRNDLDAHCFEKATNSHIWFSNSISRFTGGNLDVDIINPKFGVPAVENITYPSKSRMKPGEYKFFVHCYNNRGGTGGFRAEIEFNGEIHRYDYRNALKYDEEIHVATITLNERGNFSIAEYLPSQCESRNMWGIQTNSFVPVSTILYSPNHWDGQYPTGNRHYFFMLKGCVNPDTPNGFYNEFLNPSLLPHKHVFEALGSRMKVAPSEDQLSGLGFADTRRNDLMVKVKGASERVMKIKF